MRVKVFAALVAMLCIACIACSDAAPPSRGSAGAVTGAELPAATASSGARLVGSISGVVRLADGATVPLAPAPKQSGRVLVDPPAPCSPWSERDRQLVATGEAGALSPVHVAVTGMSTAPQRAAVTHRITFVDCRLTPRLIGAMVGDTVEVVNTSEVPLLPVLPTDKFMQAMLKGQTRSFEVKNLGPLSISCGFGAYCGEVTIIGLAHSRYAVTDARGEFKIEQLPLDQDLQLHAWHPLFEVTSEPFRLSASEPSRTVQLRLRPPSSPEPKGDAERARSEASGTVVE